MGNQEGRSEKQKAELDDSNPRKRGSRDGSAVPGEKAVQGKLITIILALANGNFTCQRKDDSTRQ